MRRMKALLALILALSLVACTAKQPTVPNPAPPAPSQPPAAPTTPEPPASATPPTPKGPAVVKDGSAYRLVGLGDANFVNWAPSGQTALVEASPALYRLRLDTAELHSLRDLGSVQMMGWAGPDTALLVRWSGESPAIGQLSLLTGEWRPLARVSRQVAICQSTDHWVWVDITEVRQGGAGSREIGKVYRTAVPEPPQSGAIPPLGGTPVLAKGALLGRLADGSCLLDGLDQRLLLLRPGGDLQTIAEGFALPRVTPDGRGVTWLKEAGDCPDCIEMGSGVPFRLLTWWRLDGKTLKADLGSPQVISLLLSPDGERLIIGHRDYEGKAGAIGSLSAGEGFKPGPRTSQPLVPVGWMGADLLAQADGPERWQSRSPIYRVTDSAQIGQWVTSGVGGGLLVEINGELRYLAPEGAAYRLSHPEPFRSGGLGVYALGMYQPQAPYVTVRQADGLLLVHLEQ
jgi:hypothetical protein